MLPLKATMQTWKLHWELQSHDSLKDGWISASTNYWEMFCHIISLKVWDGIKGLSQTKNLNNLLLTSFFMQGTSQTTVTFIEDDGGYAIIVSLRHEDVNYKVYNPKSEWAYCECL